MMMYRNDMHVKPKITSHPRHFPTGSVLNRPQKSITRCTLLIASAIVFASTVGGCGEGDKPSSGSSSTLDGEQLARTHCANCHEYPEPALLTQRSWNFLLTYMGLRMGIEDFSPLEGATPLEIEMIQNRKSLVAREGLALSVPMVSEEQWAAIRAFYMEQAPESAQPQPDKPALEMGLDLFQIREHAYGMSEPLTTLVEIDERNQQILVGDSRHQEFTVLDKHLKVVMNEITPAYQWVRAHIKDGGVHLLSIGDLMGSYRDNRIGDVVYAARREDGYVSLGVALDKLHRPSDIDFGDFDDDGLDDIVACNFGFVTGSVDIHRAVSNGWQFELKPTIRLALEKGAVDCKVEDFNKDGRPDVAVLFGNERENLSLFLNQGDGKFERKIIISQHAAFGYIGFRWGDFNADGHLDVWTINGDNIDSDPYNSLRPYHGFRLYLGQGDLTFVESYFYPMYGAYGLEVEDFDLDGDLDLAAISHNPDYDADRNDSFVYLENQGAGAFTARTFESPRTDRWLTMDAGDIDGDGDKDLVLGGVYMEVGLNVDHTELMKEMQEKATPLLILENKTR